VDVLCGKQSAEEAFLAVIESAWSPTERASAMARLLGTLLGRVGAEECLIYAARPGASSVERIHSTGRLKHPDLFDHQQNLALVEKVLQGGASVRVNDLRITICVPFSDDVLAIHSLLCCPLMQGGEMVGALELLNKSTGAFSEEDVLVVESMARPLVVALEAARRFDSAENLAITDELTGLHNFRHLMQYLGAEARRCLRYKKKVSVLFIDIDGFKRINDTYGHLVGSTALAALAQMLRSMVRDTDMVSRYGGDEFVIVLPETPLNGALVIAERIRKNVEDFEFNAHGQNVRLTVSLGVANLPKHTLTAEGLIKKADAAMYRAKELSKNTIRVAV